MKQQASNLSKPHSSQRRLSEIGGLQYSSPFQKQVGGFRVEGWAPFTTAVPIGGCARHWHRCCYGTLLLTCCSAEILHSCGLRVFEKYHTFDASTSTAVQVGPSPLYGYRVEKPNPGGRVVPSLAY